jgi:rhodanese-related sulfurtransferase
MIIVTKRLFAGVSALVVAGPALAVVSCAPGDEVDAPAVAPEKASYSFRDEERPVYEKTIEPASLQEFASKGGVVLDVRLEEDFAPDPSIITGAERRDPDQIAEWAEKLGHDRPVAVYCVKGKWVSQKAAAYLAARGVDVYSVAGGLEAWRAASPNAEPEEPMLGRR